MFCAIASFRSHRSGVLLLFAVGLSILGLSGCRTAAVAQMHTDWQTTRRAELLTPTGWLSLAGLYWLESGTQTLGSAPDSDLVFPTAAPAQLGTLTLTEEQVEFQAAPGIRVHTEGEEVTSAILTNRAAPLVLQHGSLEWHLIERAGQYGIRLRDTTLPSRIRLAEIPHYPFRQRWQLPARFIAYDSVQTRVMRNVLDMDISVEVAGKLAFTHAGQPHTLEVLDGGPDKFFIVFSDSTTGEATYGGGRYLYVNRPAANETTLLDFNRAHNPPCVFTDYATCLLPNPENELPFAVLAGEKNYGDH